MPPCSIRWCGKNSRTSCYRTDGITFHRYPSTPATKEKWINATRRENWFPSTYSVICSRHFTKDCFFNMKNRRRLLRTAVPTLMLPKLEDLPQPESQTSNEGLIQVNTIQNVSQIDPLTVQSIPVGCFNSQSNIEQFELPKPDGVLIKIENEANVYDIEVPATCDVQVKFERDDTDLQLPKIHKVESIQVKTESEDPPDPLLQETPYDAGNTANPRTDTQNTYEKPAAPIPIRPKPTEPATVFNTPSNFLTPIILFQLPQQNVGQATNQISAVANPLQPSTTTITSNVQPSNQPGVTVSRSPTENTNKTVNAPNSNIPQTLNEQSLSKRIDELLEKVELKNRLIKNLREQNRYLKNRIAVLKKLPKCQK